MRLVGMRLDEASYMCAEKKEEEAQTDVTQMRNPRSRDEPINAGVKPNFIPYND